MDVEVDLLSELFGELAREVDRLQGGLPWQASLVFFLEDLLVVLVVPFPDLGHFLVSLELLQPGLIVIEGELLFFDIVFRIRAKWHEASFEAVVADDVSEVLLDQKHCLSFHRLALLRFDLSICVFGVLCCIILHFEVVAHVACCRLSVKHLEDFKKLL